MSHTPGPWTLSPLRTSVRGADKAPVALLSARTEEQDEANARLIAAAPDLLEELRGLLDGVFHGDDREQWLLPSTERIGRLRAVLAKAEGRES